MSAVITVLPMGDGSFELTNWNQSLEEIAPLMRSYVAALDLAYDGPRGAAQVGAELQTLTDELREAVALRFDNLADLKALRDRIDRAIAHTERARREDGAA